MKDNKIDASNVKELLRLAKYRLDLLIESNKCETDWMKVNFSATEQEHAEFNKKSQRILKDIQEVDEIIRRRERILMSTNVPEVYLNGYKY